MWAPLNDGMHNEGVPPMHAAALAHSSGHEAAHFIAEKHVALLLPVWFFTKLP